MKEKARAVLIALRNVALSMSLIKIPLLLKPKQLVLYVQSELFLLKTFWGKRKLPQKNAFEVLGVRDRTAGLRLDMPNKWLGIDTSYLKDLVTLCWICRRLEAGTIFEIGTLDGFTAYHFALNTSPSAVIYSLDLPRDRGPAPGLNLTYLDELHIEYYRSIRETVDVGTPEQDRIVRLYGDSAKFDFSPYHGRVDLFFIDGAHSYDYVRSDTLNALKCVRPGGVIAWHDYGRAGVNGVSRWLHELAGRYEIFSVPGSSLAYMVVK